MQHTDIKNLNLIKEDAIEEEIRKQNHNKKIFSTYRPNPSSSMSHYTNEELK